MPDQRQGVDGSGIDPVLSGAETDGFQPESSDNDEEILTADESNGDLGVTKSKRKTKGTRKM